MASDQKRTRVARFRQSDVRRALKAAKEADLPISSVRIEPNGTIVIVQGEPQPAPPPAANDWDC